MTAENRRHIIEKVIVYTCALAQCMEESAMQEKTANKSKDTLSIIIVGCGKVGHTLTEQLVGEGHDITIVDTNERVIRDTTELFDVMGIRGNGTGKLVVDEQCSRRHG